jgi:hypothetical protein
MTSQLNPAWQRKPASSNHLAKISEQFLSNRKETGRNPGLCRVIPFLLDSPQQAWVTHDLCEALNRRGHKSILCHLDEEKGQMRTDLGQLLHAQAGDCECCLLPMTSPVSLQRHHLDHVVMLVPASLDAVRTAYRRIKFLSGGRTPEIGIVVVGARDQHAAWRYFRKLAVGTLRYLDVPLLNLGFIPEPVTPDHGPKDQHRNNFLTRISERLLHSQFYLTAGKAGEQP